jgi:endonuclease YncB( thermonuclease family)
MEQAHGPYHGAVFSTFIIMRPTLYAFVILLCLAFSTEKAPERQQFPKEFSAKVVKILDGDTFDVLDSVNRVSRIRMNGIDAPEKKQAYGSKSRETLSNLCFGKKIKVRVYSLDRNKRLIADSYINGRSLSHTMVAEGMAWHFRKYSSDTSLAHAEALARAARRGLWADASPQAPWDYRASRRH